MSTDTITTRTYEQIDKAYAWFNQRLFDGTLPPCLITFQRSRRARGYYWQESVKARRGKRRTDEIALNPNSFPGRSDKDVMSTLVHEMVHLWQGHNGHPGRRGYHNRDWSEKMEAVGLMASTTGQPGGDKTGERVSHYVIAGGPFEVAWVDLYHTGFRLGWEGRVPERTEKDKVKYACPECKLAVWGKPGLGNKLQCLECEEILVLG